MKLKISRVITFMLAGLALGGASASSQAQGYDDYPPDYGPPSGYYPEYDPPPISYYGGDDEDGDYNPSVRRDYYQDDREAPDGTYHSEDIVEDRRASYYSPGRNYAITRPQTAVDYWSEGPGHEIRRTHTRWIGADGKPHSTTVESETTTDPYGDSHTDTLYTLRKGKIQ